jgi:hypothetical protein
MPASPCLAQSEPALVTLLPMQHAPCPHGKHNQSSIHCLLFSGTLQSTRCGHAVDSSGPAAVAEQGVFKMTGVMATSSYVASSHSSLHTDASPADLQPRHPIKTLVILSFVTRSAAMAGRHVNTQLAGSVRITDDTVALAVLIPVQRSKLTRRYYTMQTSYSSIYTQLFNSKMF